jgi:parallel beta-helix repeat protein
LSDDYVPESWLIGGAGAGDCWDWSHAGEVQLNAVIGALKASEVGIEDLTMEFPNHAWGHHKGYDYNSGYNGIDLNQCSNCWIKNVTIKNSDNGIFLTQSKNVTVDGAHA